MFLSFLILLFYSILFLSHLSFIFLSSSSSCLTLFILLSLFLFAYPSFPALLLFRPGLFLLLTFLLLRLLFPVLFLFHIFHVLAHVTVCSGSNEIPSWSPEMPQILYLRNILQNRLA